MRPRGRDPIRRFALIAAAAALTWSPSPASAQTEPGHDTARASATPSCHNSCRGLGVKKVQAGSEHCGLIPRESKDEALDAACGLAESDRERLLDRAEEIAREKCAGQADEPACACRTEIRDWQNVYTHVLSQNCWTECGWAFLIDCESRPDDDG